MSERRTVLAFRAPIDNLKTRHQRNRHARVASARRRFYVGVMNGDTRQSNSRQDDRFRVCSEFPLAQLTDRHLGGHARDSFPEYLWIGGPNAQGARCIGGSHWDLIDILTPRLTSSKFRPTEVPDHIGEIPYPKCPNPDSPSEPADRPLGQAAQRAWRPVCQWISIAVTSRSRWGEMS